MTGETIRLLLAGWDERDVRAFAEVTGKLETSYQFCVAETAGDVLRWIERKGFDLVALDVRLPGGMDLDLKALGGGIPVIFLTKASHVDGVLDALKNGASDFLVTDPERHHVRLLPLMIDRVLADRGEKARMREREELFRQFFQVAALGKALGKADGSLIEVNQALCEMTGFTEPELLAIGMENLGDARDVGIEKSLALQMLAGECRSYHVEKRLRHKQGKVVWAQVFATLVRDAGGKPTLIIYHFLDLTERRALEEEQRRLEQGIQEIQRLESLGVLAGGIAHDFNNLLTAILGNTSLLMMDYGPESAAFGSLEQIEQASIRAAELCKRMLMISGQGRFALRPIVVNELVQETAGLVKSSLGPQLHLELQLEAELPQIDADAPQLRQALVNLMVNASEAMEGKSGLIRVASSRIRWTPEVARNCLFQPQEAMEEYVVVEVADEGPGMEPGILKKAFDPFYSTKFEGRGLGLPAVLGIVRGHDGAISVDSQPGVGSVFRLLFPATRKSANVRPERPLAFQSGRGRSVLVADDEESLRRVTARILNTLVPEVVEASNGVEALRLFKERPSDFAVVLMDLIMPQMGGIEALKEMKRLRPGLPVVLMSGYDQGHVHGKSTMADSVVFLQKPFQAMELRELIRGLLGPSP